MGKKKDMRAAMVGVIKTRLAWGEGETFPWAGAYMGEAYAHEAEIEESIPEKGEFTVAIPLSVHSDDDADTHVVVRVQLSVEEIIGEDL